MYEDRLTQSIFVLNLIVLGCHLCFIRQVKSRQVANYFDYAALLNHKNLHKKD